MSLVDTKTLTKLAKLCRKLGISHFKTEGYEFTLADRSTYSLPKIRSKKKSLIQETLDQIEEEIPGDLPTQEELLFWSSGQLNEESKAE